MKRPAACGAEDSEEFTPPNGRCGLGGVLHAVVAMLHAKEGLDGVDRESELGPRPRLGVEVGVVEWNCSHIVRVNLIPIICHHLLQARKMKERLCDDDHLSDAFYSERCFGLFPDTLTVKVRTVGTKFDRMIYFVPTLSLDCFCDLPLGDHDRQAVPENGEIDGVDHLLGKRDVTGIGLLHLGPKPERKTNNSNTRMQVLLLGRYPKKDSEQLIDELHCIHLLSVVQASPEYLRRRNPRFLKHRFPRRIKQDEHIYYSINYDKKQ